VSNRALRQRDYTVIDICRHLLNANIPFGLALVGSTRSFQPG
jgi:hypothetical protein